MVLSLFALLEAAALSSSLSIDAFTAGFAYGNKKIRIPLPSVVVINLICGGIMGLSILVGSLIGQYLPNWITIAAAFIILFVIGLSKLMDSITKSIIRKHSDFNKQIKISMFNLKFILNLYANPEEADIDASKLISPKEASLLALSLSLDGIAVGFGAALANINGWLLLLCSLMTDSIAIILGCFFGNKIADSVPYNISWISGVILIMLAFSKFF